MKAVVVEEIDKFGLTEVDLDLLNAGEVLIKMKATGVCHSNLSIINGTIPNPRPVVLGHEGAEIVEDVGDGKLVEQCVKAARRGDQVVIVHD